MDARRARQVADGIVSEAAGAAPSRGDASSTDAAGLRRPRHVGSWAALVLGLAIGTRTIFAGAGATFAVGYVLAVALIIIGGMRIAVRS